MESFFKEDRMRAKKLFGYLGWLLIIFVDIQDNIRVPVAHVIWAIRK
jgi:hypothetical protein